MVIQTYLNNEIWLELNVAFITIFSQAQFTQRFWFPGTKMFYAGLAAGYLTDLDINEHCLRPLYITCEILSTKT